MKMLREKSQAMQYIKYHGKARCNQMVLSSTWCFFFVSLAVCLFLFVRFFVCLFVFFRLKQWTELFCVFYTLFQKQYNIRKSTLIIWERFLFYYVDQIFLLSYFFTVALMDPRSCLASSVCFVKFFKFFLIQKPAYRK